LVELKRKIEKLKRDRKALVLAHNYQLDEVQEVADYVGDSFYLSKVAAQIDCEVIVFGGVRFMAETAKLLSPDKVVLLPEADAGCPLADTITAEDVRALKRQYPGVPVVCYINSSTEVKAESDICCTSANAVKIVAALPEKQVIFVPDGNLGDYVAKQLSAKELVLWQGCCNTHAKVKPENIVQMREQYPAAKIFVHPECDPAVVEIADFAGSTSEIIRQAETSSAEVLIIGTEVGVLCNLRASQPGKRIFLLHPGLVCPNMKKTKLQSIYDALANNHCEIQIDALIADKAKRAIIRMLEVG